GTKITIDGDLVGRRRRRVRDGGIGALAVATRLLTAHAIDGPPPGDRRRPRPHRPAAAVVARRLAPDLEEHLLGHLLGVAGVVKDALADTEYQGGELVVERAKGALV